MAILDKHIKTSTTDQGLLKSYGFDYHFTSGNGEKWVKASRGNLYEIWLPSDTPFLLRTSHWNLYTKSWDRDDWGIPLSQGMSLAEWLVSHKL